MDFNSRLTAGRIVTALLATALSGAVLADPGSKPAQNPATAVSNGSSATPSGGVARKRLDLKAPALNRVLSPSQIESLTSRPDDVSEGAETVAVEGTRNERIIAPSGFRGLAWGMRHPTQAWRLFVPYPSD